MPKIGANKAYGTNIMIGESTYLLAKSKITARFLDFLTVKGKNEPVRVYELVSAKGDEPSDWADLFSQYDAGMAEYTNRNWEKSEKIFEHILSRWPADGASRTYLDRCREFLVNPPEPGWDGVFRLKHK